MMQLLNEEVVVLMYNDSRIVLGPCPPVSHKEIYLNDSRVFSTLSTRRGQVQYSLILIMTLQSLTLLANNY
jgi:hypothetical protein